MFFAFASLLSSFRGRDAALYVRIWSDYVVPYNGNDMCAGDEEFLALATFFADTLMLHLAFAKLAFIVTF